MTKSIVVALVFLTLVPLGIPLCNVPRPRLVCAEYSNSKMVVVATLIHKEMVREKDDPEGIAAHIYTMKTQRVLKGNPAPTFKIYEENTSGRAGFGWNKGTTYLLFLFSDKAQKAWGLDGCGNSGPLQQSKKALRQIDEMKTKIGGTIYGVISATGLSETLGGISVQAIGQGQRFRAKSNEVGEFQLSVPAGNYSLRATQKGHSFEPDDFTYESPVGLKIENGGCAQVQLVRTN